MHHALVDSSRPDPALLDAPTQKTRLPLSSKSIHSTTDVSALFGMPVLQTSEANPAAARPAFTQQKLARMEGAFASISEVAHDLRHSLALIRGSGQLLMTPGTVDTSYYAKIINDETIFLSRLVQDILDLSRLELGQFKLEPSWMDLGALVRSNADTASLSSTTHTIQVNLPEHLPLIYADPVRIHRVLLNLLMNAINYCPNDTLITVTVGLSDSPGRRVYISVQDEGPGIPADVRPHLFDRCSPGTPNHWAQGSGLGLSICRGIVEAHGGNIWVDSEEGEGSTFTFWLPCASAVNGEQA